MFFFLVFLISLLFIMEYLIQIPYFIIFFLYFRLSKNSTTYKIEFVDESVVDPVKRNASYQV